MPSLRTLRLDDNKLVGTIPASMLNVLQLREVTLSKNLITGQLPFVNLTSLDLSHNLLEGVLPQFGARTTYLNLDDNKLEGDIVNLSNLTVVAYLHIASNNLTGTLSLSESQLRAIKVLNMAYTSISSIAQTVIVPNRPVFKSCDMSNAPLRCPIPDWAISNCNAVCQ